jgi:hypothetical protein
VPVKRPPPTSTPRWCWCWCWCKWSRPPLRPSSGKLWIGATGAYYRLDCSTHNVSCDPGTNVHVLGETSQCQAAAFINRFSNLSGKITRIYFFTFTDGRSGDNTGTVSSAGTTARKAYYVVRDRAESCTY